MSIIDLIIRKSCSAHKNIKHRCKELIESNCQRFKKQELQNSSISTKYSELGYDLSDREKVLLTILDNCGSSICGRRKLMNIVYLQQKPTFDTFTDFDEQSSLSDDHYSEQVFETLHKLIEKNIVIENETVVHNQQLKEIKLSNKTYTETEECNSKTISHLINEVDIKKEKVNKLLEKIHGFEEVNLQEKVVLTLLYELHKNNQTPIKSRLKLHKLVFFAEYYNYDENKLSNKNILGLFEYTLFEEGVYCIDVSYAIDSLVEKGYIDEKIISSPEGTYEEISLSPKFLQNKTDELLLDDKSKIKQTVDTFGMKIKDEMQTISLKLLDLDTESFDYIGSIINSYLLHKETPKYDEIK